MGAEKSDSRAGSKQTDQSIARDYQKSRLQPEVLHDFGRVEVVAYNAPKTSHDKLMRKAQEMQRLKDTLAPCSKRIAPPADLYTSIFMANDKALLSLLEESRDYRKACITDISYVTENDAIEHAKGCQCIWLSRLFLEVPSTYPELFQTDTKTEGKGNEKREYHFWAFEPRKLKESVYRKLTSAKEYLNACKPLIQNQDVRNYLNDLTTGIEHQYKRFMGL